MTASLLTTTIAAIATAIVPQQGSVGIVRMSGPEAFSIARKLFKAPGKQVWESHRILYGQIQDLQAEPIDEALLLLMRAPRSYTQEDVVEFQCHGGIMVVQQVLQLCIAAGARLAQPGEFTLRAFLNGRIDLTQAESVADLVSAQSPQAASLALAGVQGKLAKPIHTLRSTCLDILAEIEARVDFEDDLPPLDEAEIQQQLQSVLTQLNQILATADRGALLRGGIKVAIVGQPNVGKSSLLNAWSRSDRAIVTDLPGTTRDVVESQLVVGEIPVQVLDTAGIRETADQVERIGVARSQAAAQEADLVLLTLDATVGWTAAETEIYQQLQSEIQGRGLIVVLNKMDLLEPNTLTVSTSTSTSESTPLPSDLPDFLPSQTPLVKTAAAQNQGIDALEAAILGVVHAGIVQASHLDLAINQRQAAALTRAHTALNQVQQTIADQMPFDFWTIDLRGAIQALGEVTGEGMTEPMLERIFSRFCIGK